MSIHPPELLVAKLLRRIEAYGLGWHVLRAAAFSAIVAGALLGSTPFDGIQARRPHALGDTRHVVRVSSGPAIAKITSPATVAVAGGLTAHVASGAPLDLLRVTSDFGMRLHPILGVVRMHEGVDLGAPEGAPVLAAADGMVTDAGPAGGYGNMLHIRHAAGWVTGYAHLSAFAPGIASGTRVTRGQVVAFVGHTGLATGPHLHFELSLNGVKLDPMLAPATQLGTRGVFHWTALLGQSGAIDLAYRNRQLLLHDHSFNPKAEVIVPIEPITVAAEEHGRAPPPTSESVNLASTAQVQEVALLAPAPAQTFQKQSFFGQSQRTSNRLPIPGSW